MKIKWEEFYEVEIKKPPKPVKSKPEIKSIQEIKELSEKNKLNDPTYKVIEFVKPKGLFVQLDGQLKQRIKIGRPLYTLQIPKASKKFYHFAGWMHNGKIISLKTIIKEDMVLTPCFKRIAK